MNSEERQRKIIDFVGDHPGTLTERVCEELRAVYVKKNLFSTN